MYKVKEIESYRFAKFFEENQTNLKKIWEATRNLLNVSTKSATLLNKIVEKNEIFTDANKISNKLKDMASETN